MTLRAEYRDLGMDRRIPRRDFLNGLAVGLTSAYALTAAPAIAAARADAADAADAAAPQAAASSSTPYPPALTGLRGNYPSAVAAFGPMQAGTFRQFPALDVDTRESYDLAIVGGGISGLAAAHFWRRALRNNQEDLLILDGVHDDFWRARQTQRVPAMGRNVHRLWRHDGDRDAVSLQLHRQAPGRRAGDPGRAQQRVPESRRLSEAQSRPRDVLRQGALRRGPGRRRQWTHPLAGIPRESAAVGCGPHGSRAAARAEPRLHGRHERRREDRDAREDQLAGIPAQVRKGQPRRDPLLPWTGRSQQQTGGHDAGARSRETWIRRLQRAGTGTRGRLPGIVRHRSTFPTATRRSRGCS